MEKKVKKYNQLKLVDRERIGIYHAMGMSAREIAKRLDRHHTTISREISRNNNILPAMRGYIGCQANDASKKRKITAATRPRLKDERIRAHTKEKLVLGWSPEQIARTTPNYVPGKKISHEAIYQYVYADYREGIGFLARRHKQRLQKFKFRKRQTSNIPNRIGIEYRSINANNRNEFGHWESDSIVSNQSSAAINVLVERKSRMVKIQHLVSKRACFTYQAICKSLGTLPNIARISITYDNGSENVKHENVNHTLKIKSFFCQPYHSWEKGSVENTNGLIRRFIPKKTNLANVTQQQLNRIEHLLNNRPRKCLGYKTPSEVFYKFSGALPP
jgi:transposase, IS30 family